MQLVEEIIDNIRVFNVNYKAFIAITKPKQPGSKMTGLPPTNFFRRPAVIGWLVFFILITAMGALSYQRYLLFKEARKGVLTNAAMNARDKLKATLDYSATATRTLAFIIDRNAGNINFDTVAKRLLDNYRFVDALELVEGGTITRIYPLAPNAAAIGYDILKDTLVNKEAERAIKEKKTLLCRTDPAKTGLCGGSRSPTNFLGGKILGIFRGDSEIVHAYHGCGA